jgi:transaldolase
MMKRPFRIFYDGLNIEKYAAHPKVEGFTTNCSIFGKSPIKSYEAFWAAHAELVGSRPFSLQVWHDHPDEVIEQIKQIHKVNPNIFVKVPILNSLGEYNETPIRYAVKNKIPLNITAIHSMEQITKAAEFLEGSKAKEIISIFGGPISDLLLDPREHVGYAVELFKAKPNSEILWAGCRELYTIRRAEEYGCHCITIPDAMMERLALLDKSLLDLTLDRVRLFKNDADNGNFIIRNA